MLPFIVIDKLADGKKASTAADEITMVAMK